MKVRSGLVRLAVMAMLSATAWPAAARPAAPQPDRDARKESESAVPAALKHRVDDWWDARSERDHQKMYELYEPGYRATITFAKFLQESAVRSRYDIVGHRVLRMKTRDAAHVFVVLQLDTTLMKFGGPYTVEVVEPWVKVDDEWFKEYEPFKLPLPDTPR
jgi:hypothetical protein